MNTKTLKLPKYVYIIGVGGVGSWIVPMLSRLVGERSNTTIILVDGDKLEHKNLDRQFFREEDIGRFKAEALAEVTRCSAINEYLHDGTDWVAYGALTLCCVDNHPARRVVLDRCDRTASKAIIAGNEFIDADAYYYEPSMKGTRNDPRVFAPEISTDLTGDPLRTAGCVGEPQRETPQLIVANVTAAVFVMRLLWYWFAEVPSAANDEERSIAYEFGPVMLNASAGKTWETRWRKEA